MIKIEVFRPTSVVRVGDRLRTLFVRPSIEFGASAIVRGRHSVEGQ